MNLKNDIEYKDCNQYKVVLRRNCFSHETQLMQKQLPQNYLQNKFIIFDN